VSEWGGNGTKLGATSSVSSPHPPPPPSRPTSTASLSFPSAIHPLALSRNSLSAAPCPSGSRPGSSSGIASPSLVAKHLFATSCRIGVGEGEDGLGVGRREVVGQAIKRADGPRRRLLVSKHSSDSKFTPPEGGSHCTRTQLPVILHRPRTFPPCPSSHHSFRPTINFVRASLTTATQLLKTSIY
jgi:hypothetical protein